MPADLLKALGLATTNSGTYLGSGEWSTTTDAGLLQSINPTTNEVIAEVHASSQADYEKVVARAQAAFKIWRTAPAPRRACAARRCAPTRTRSARWSRWKWARARPKATAKCRR